MQIMQRLAGKMVDTWGATIQLGLIFVVGCSNASHMCSMTSSIHHNGQHLALILNV